MNLGSIIIGATLIAIVVVPIVLMEVKRKKREHKKLKSLLNIANQQDCIISKHEVCADFIIGIDESNKKVFFVKQQKEEALTLSVDLNETQSCKVINTNRTFKSKEGSQKVIDRLELSFIPTNKNKSETKMEFFNADLRGQLNGELQCIEKWSKLVNALL